MSTISDSEETAGHIKMLTLEGVAKVLGVTPATARSLVHSGEIVGFQIGGRGIWRVDPADLTEFINREKARAQQRRGHGPQGNSDPDDNFQPRPRPKSPRPKTDQLDARPR